MSTTNLNQPTIAPSLNSLLADLHHQAMRARFYHWNVTGIWFAPLHELFGQHYDALSAVEDSLAERLRALGLPAPQSIVELIAATRLSDDTTSLDAMTMLRQLLSGYEHLNQHAGLLRQLAEQNDDAVTGDMMVALMTEWQKSIWMLRAHLS